VDLCGVRWQSCAILRIYAERGVTLCVRSCLSGLCVMMCYVNAFESDVQSRMRVNEYRRRTLALTLLCLATSDYRLLCKPSIRARRLTGGTMVGISALGALLRCAL
jgi:hypothetical protein